MAYSKHEEEYAPSAAPKKADLILKQEGEIYARALEIANETRQMGAKIDASLGQIEKCRQDAALSARQATEIYKNIQEEYAALKRELKYLAAQSENIFLSLTEKIENLSNAVSGGKTSVAAAAANVQAEIDYDKLAQKVIELMPAQEAISADYIASKVAEQIVVPEAQAETVSQAETQQVYAGVPAEVQINEEELADRIALKVGSLKAEDFDILVDDDGCGSISEAIADKLDYDLISANLAEKLRSALELAAANEPDYDEMAARISEKITVAGVNEDAIADKAAAVLSNYLPEIDTDDIADKVANQVISSLPALDENIAESVSEKIVEKQSAGEYDIVVDEDGIGKITESVSEEVLKNTDDRFNSVDNGISEIKAMLLGGAVVREVETAAAAEAYDEGYVAEESTLVTVSDIVEEKEGAAEEEDEVINEIVEEIDEEPATGEIMPDMLSSSVDFEHMMKYNRSFIARIIQGTDEQKQYYGAVKNALLSYAKVNSNVAWGAERFNKGRETIARFKIRGKTLCLYLALDPAEYKTSVYHQADVSDNKSMHGTPMMVKIKSPLGARKAIRLIDDMLEKRGGVKRNTQERDYAAMYPYETIDELIEDGLVKDVSKNK